MLALFGAALGSLLVGCPGHSVTTYFSTLYLVLDLLLALYRPQAFRSPKPIVLHHAITLAILVEPIIEPRHAVFASYALIVECNTLAMTLRRTLGYPRYMEWVFWGTWVSLRLVWFPLLCGGMLLSAHSSDPQRIPLFFGSFTSPPSPRPTAYLFLAITALQFYTTYVLVCKAKGRKKKD
ncbi:hypothetical protein M885DRAFT_500635 [Pelagophyceae sp. CCMP2097]|nr:hypothetical protein M885DRAFT_500635 [Pelagophyceae sp. CCMP2097]